MDRVQLEELLREKEVQLAELEKEIEALHVVTRLLAEREASVIESAANIAASPPAIAAPEPGAVFIPDAPVRAAVPNTATQATAPLAREIPDARTAPQAPARAAVPMPIPAIQPPQVTNGGAKRFP